MEPLHGLEAEIYFFHILFWWLSWPFSYNFQLNAYNVKYSSKLRITPILFYALFYSCRVKGLSTIDGSSCSASATSSVSTQLFTFKYNPN